MASQKGNGESKIHLPQHRKDSKSQDKILFVIDGSGSMDYPPKSDSSPKGHIKANLAALKDLCRNMILCEFGEDTDNVVLHTNLDKFIREYMRTFKYTYTKQIGAALCFTTGITRICFHGDGGFNDTNFSSHIKKAASLGKLNNLTHFYMTFAYTTSDDVINTLKSELLKIMDSCDNAITVTFLKLSQNNNPCQLYDLIKSGQSDYTLYVPEGFIRIGNICSVPKDVDVSELLSMFRSNNLILEVRQFIFDTITVNPRILLSHRVYKLLHQVLLSFYKDNKKEYLDKISVIKGKLTGESAKLVTEILNVTRDNIERTKEIVEALSKKTTSRFILPSQQNLSQIKMNDANKDGSGYLICAIINDVFEGGQPYATTDTKKDGMPMSPLFTTHEIYEALSLLFHNLFPNIIISQQQVFLCIMRILGLDNIKLPGEFIKMLEKLFADPKVIQKMFGFIEDKIELNAKWYSPIVAKTYHLALLQNQDLILNNCEYASEILDIFKYNHSVCHIVNSLKTVVHQDDGLVKIEINPNPYGLGIGAIVMMYTIRPEEPWKNIPSVGVIVSGVTGSFDSDNQSGNAQYTVLYLDQKECEPDTYRIPAKFLTPVGNIGDIDDCSSDEDIKSNIKKIMCVPMVNAINTYLLTLTGEVFSKEAKYIPSVRVAEEEKIKTIISGYSVSGVVQPSIPVEVKVKSNILCEFLVAKFGLPPALYELIVSKSDKLSFDTINLLIKCIQNKDTLPLPTHISLVYKGVYYTLNPNDIFGSYEKKLKVLLSQELRISSSIKTKELREMYCVVCMEDIPVDCLVWFPCHHVICKDCKEVMDSNVSPPTPGEKIENFNCFACRKTIETPHEKLTEFFKSHGPIQPGTVAMWCNNSICCEAFVQPMPCGGDEANLGKLCDSCKPDDLIVDVKYCPGCNRQFSKDEGCDHITCICNTHFCCGCLYVFTGDQIDGVEYEHWVCNDDCDDAFVNSKLNVNGESAEEDDSDDNDVYTSY